MTDTEVAEAAEALCGGRVNTVSQVHGGGNNRIYRVDSEKGPFAFKAYASHVADSRDRLGAEFDGLTFLRAHGLESVPDAIACDRKSGFGLYEWIEGRPIDAPGTPEIEAALDFCTRLKNLAREQTALRLPPASEACLSGGELIAQIEKRLGLLAGAAAECLALGNFLEDASDPAFAVMSRRALEGFEKAGWNIESDIDTALRTLSPSDFGFHNALIRDDNSVVFLDFEYFGWDDPVRLVADFLLHPGMDLDEPAKRLFAEGAHRIFADDETFRQRLWLLFPLVGLRWCLIMLNEFLPDNWQRRTFAGSEDREAAQDTQLRKSRSLLNRLLENEGEFSYVK